METNNYFYRKEDKNLNTSYEEIRKLLGIHIEIGSIRYPQLRLYWSKKRLYDLIADAMPYNRFSVLRNNLHAVDNMIDNRRARDKFWKVRPIVDAFMKGLPETPAKIRLSIDKQIMPFRGHIPAKQ